MKFSRWINHLFLNILHNHIVTYPTPKNITYSWSFGSLAGLCLVLQLATGLFLSMHYIPHIDLAFFSLEHIMRDVNFGWLTRYLHANGASMFFLVIFFHIFRNIYYGSYYFPRITLWSSGIIIFFLLMAAAFMGYVLPWGQMSFWGATVITNLFSAIPVYGVTIVEWIWGGFSVDQATLNRFYSFHFLIPFIIAALALIHLVLLHDSGSNDPIGLDSNVKQKHPAFINFFPYFYVKDFFIFLILLLIIFILISFMPNLLGHPDNYIFANPMVTPAHIVPEWYFLPFYAILRSVPNKLAGVILMAISILILLFLPFFVGKIKSPEFKFFYTLWVWFFGINFLLLGYLGQLPVQDPYITVAQCCTSLYFFLIVIVLPSLQSFTFGSPASYV
jgi:ubiquinol-cytochrome c reductase cytochrome b subunit